jgi:predicted GIY-YIG superfamily endonuclease
MTTKPVTGYRIKDGKLIRVIRYATKRKKIAAEREVKAWKSKQK